VSILITETFGADNADLGAQWTPGVQSMRITSNAAVFASGSDADSNETHTTALPAAQWAEATLKSPIAGGVGQGYGVCLRATSGASGSYYRAVGNASGWELVRFAGGSFVGSIASGSGTTFADGDRIYLEFQGNNWIIKKNTTNGTGGTTVSSGSDTNLPSNTLAGPAYSSSGGGGGVSQFLAGDFSSTGSGAPSPGSEKGNRNRPGRGPYSVGKYYRRTAPIIRFPTGGTQFNQAIGGTLDFIGTIQKQTNKGLSGALSFAGNLAKQTASSLTGSISFNGALTSTAVFLKALTGAVSFTGTLTKMTLKSLSAGLSFVGTLSKQTGKNLIGGLSFVGALSKQTSRSLSGVVTFAGNLAASFLTSKAVTGVVSFAGTLGTLLIPFVPGSAVKAWRKVWQGLWRQVNGSDD
jgi:hypothetical protein